MEPPSGPPGRGPDPLTPGARPLASRTETLHLCCFTPPRLRCCVASAVGNSRGDVSPQSTSAFIVL